MSPGRRDPPRGKAEHPAVAIPQSPEKNPAGYLTRRRPVSAPPLPTPPLNINVPVFAPDGSSFVSMTPKITSWEDAGSKNRIQLSHKRAGLSSGRPDQTSLLSLSLMVTRLHRRGPKLSASSFHTSQQISLRVLGVLRRHLSLTLAYLG